MKIESKTFHHLSRTMGFTLLLLSLFVLPTSCNQGNLEEDLATSNAPAIDEEDPIPTRYEYYLDSEQVDQEAFDPEDPELIVDVSGEKDPAFEGGGLIKIWGFTSEDTYLQWGDEHDLPIACILTTSRHLAEYAETSGAKEHYERYGEVLPEYEEYAQDYFAMMNCRPGENSGQERSIGFFYKELFGSNNLALGAAGMVPFMAISWNNEVSRYMTLGLYDGLTVFDRAFFFRRMTTVWNWGYHHWRFEFDLAWLDDRLSSCIIW